MHKRTTDPHNRTVEYKRCAVAGRRLAHYFRVIPAEHGTVVAVAAVVEVRLHATVRAFNVNHRRRRRVLVRRVLVNSARRIEHQTEPEQTGLTLWFGIINALDCQAGDAGRLSRIGLLGVRK